MKKFEIIKDPYGFFTIKDKPTTKQLKDHYEKLFNEFDPNSKIRKNYQESYNEQEMNQINLINNLCIHSLETYNPEWKSNPGSILEIGVGEGFFLNSANKKGWKIYGIDFNLNGIEKFNPHLKKFIETGDAFEILKRKINQKKTYDVLVIQNVLEHVLDPKRILSDLNEILNENGIIVIRVPNDFSRLQLRAKELNMIKDDFWVLPPEHLNYFNSENLKKFLIAMNFKLIDMYASFPIDFFLYHSGSNYVNDQKKGKEAHKARVELDLIIAEKGIENYHRFCQVLAICGIGRTLTVLIKK